jgi:hypothetical protein
MEVMVGVCLASIAVILTAAVFALWSIVNSLKCIDNRLAELVAAAKDKKPASLSISHDPAAINTVSREIYELRKFLAATEDKRERKASLRSKRGNVG